MTNTEKETITIPVSAQYSIIDGKPVRVDAEYVTVPVEVVAAFIAEKFGLKKGA